MEKDVENGKSQEKVIEKCKVSGMMGYWGTRGYAL